MAYIPVSVAVYMGAYAGALAGINASGGQRFLIDNVPGDYSHHCKVAGAWAQEFDTLYNNATPNALQVQEVISMSTAIWNGFPIDAASETPSFYSTGIAGILALLTQSDTFYTGQGITPTASLQTGTYIFRPGETNPSGNIYASWASMYTATQQYSGPKTIVFDDSKGACSIPVGGYDFGKGCVFLGVTPNGTGASSNRVQVAIPNGVTIATPLYRIRDVALNYSGTGALMTIPADSHIWHVFVEGYTRLVPSGAAGRIFQLQPLATLTMTLKDYATCIVSGGAFIVDATGGDGTTGLEIDMVGNLVVSNVLPTNSLKGPAGPIYTFVALSFQQIVTAQGSMPGGIITPIIELGTGRNLSYTVFDGTKWAVTAPIKVGSATLAESGLDRLAAAVSGLLGGPIP